MMELESRNDWDRIDARLTRRGVAGEPRALSERRSLGDLSSAISEAYELERTSDSSKDYRKRE